MPQTQTTGRDIMTAPGFWDKPEKDQITALAGVSAKFKAAPPEAQHAMLAASHRMIQEHPELASQTSEPPSPSKHSMKASDPEEERQVSKMETPLLGFARSATEKVLGTMGQGLGGGVMHVAGSFTNLTPQQRKAGQSFGRGFGEGIADAGIDMTSVVNLSALGAMKGLKYGGRLAQAARAAAAGTFSMEMFKDLPKEFDAAREAYQKGDMEAAGKAFSHATADVVFGVGGLREMKGAGRVAAGKAPAPGRPTKMVDLSGRPPEPVTTESRKSTSAVESGEVDRPVERQNPKLVEQIRTARGAKGEGTPPEPVKAGGSREDIEREIGRTQDDINRLEGMRGSTGVPAQITALEGRIRELRNQIPEFSTDPAIAARAVKRPATEAQKPAKATEPLPATTAERGKERAAAATQRAKEGDPTANWRAGWEAMGIRIAPEETGELPTQKPPVNRPIVPSGKAVTPEEFWRKQNGTAPPEPVIPDGTQPGAGSATQAQQFTAAKLPGVPAGSTVIFREVGPQGTVVDVVDPNGRLTPATLPFRDSVENMEAKGWITAKRGGATFRGAQPEPGRVAVPPEIVRENRPGEQLPAVIPPKTGPPEATMTFLSPQQLAASVQRANPKLLPEPGITHEMEPIEEATAGAGQPPEVVRHAASQMEPTALKSYIERMNQAFLNQMRGVDPAKLSDEQKTLVQQAYGQLQEYLKPFTETLQEKSKPARARRAAKPKAAAVSNVGPAPESIKSEVQNIIASAIKREGGTPWKSVKVQPVGDDLRTPIGDPITVPTEEFTPEAVWGLISKAKGAAGIAVSDPDVGPRNGIVRRRLEIPSAAPPEVVRQ